MTTKKQRPGDLVLVCDEFAAPVERASAMMRLAVDGHTEMIELAEQWLSHDSVDLRLEAIRLLIGGWELRDRIPQALHLIRHDPAPAVRATAARALLRYHRRTGESRDLTLRALVDHLRNDEDEVNQQGAYEQLLAELRPNDQLPALPRDFDRERDVDWELLRPWMEPPSGNG